MAFKTAVLLPLFLATTFLAYADDTHPLALAEIPAAAQKTITAQIGDGKLGDIEKTNEAGETVYAVDFTSASGSEKDFTVSEDGTLLSTELSYAEAPATVQRTIQSQALGWGLVSLDKNLDDTEPSYDVEVTKDGKSRTFTVAEDGDLLSEEVSLSTTPAVVQTAIKAKIADGAFGSIEEIFEPDGNSFDVRATTKDGGRLAFSVSPAGQLLREEVSLDKLPPPARKCITTHIGDGKVICVEKSLFEKKDGVLPFLVQGRKDGRPFDFSVGPRGRFLGVDTNK